MSGEVFEGHVDASYPVSVGLEQEPQRLETARLLNDQIVWPGTPGVEYIFYFGAHSMATDHDHMSRALAEADIFFPEEMGWNTHTLMRQRKVARGKEYALRDELDHIKKLADASSVFAAVNQAAREAYANTLFGSRAQVGFVDLPLEHDLCEDVLDMQIRQYTPIDLSNGAEGVAQQVAAGTLLEARIQLEREHHILTQLPGTIAEIASKSANLRNKSPLKTVIQIGGAHTRLSHFLIKQGERVVRRFPAKPFFMGVKYDLVRRAMWGLPLLKTRLVQSVFESLITESLLDPEAINVSNSIDLLRITDQAFSDYSWEEYDEIIGRLNAEEDWRPILGQRVFEYLGFVEKANAKFFWE